MHYGIELIRSLLLLLLLIREIQLVTRIGNHTELLAIVGYCQTARNGRTYGSLMDTYGRRYPSIFMKITH
jgi:hypothetical protein